MTDDDIIRLPGSQTDPETQTDETRRELGRGRPSPTDEADDESNPLLKEGPDAPDAADIEDPDEQL
jgi:hypothetical protein